MDQIGMAMKLVGVGFFIAGVIVLFTLGGLWLDSIFDTRPILLFIGLGLGLAAAGLGVFRLLLPLIDKQGRNRGR